MVETKLIPMDLWRNPENLAKHVGELMLKHISTSDIQKFKVVLNSRESLIEIFMSATSPEAQDRFWDAMVEHLFPDLCKELEMDVILVNSESSVFQPAEEDFNNLGVFTYPHQ